MELDGVLKDRDLFVVFSLALMMVAKSSRLLSESGANPEAIRHINTAIEMISRQLDNAAVRMEIELHAIKDIEDLCKNLGIPRTNTDPTNNPTGK